MTRGQRRAFCIERKSRRSSSGAALAAIAGKDTKQRASCVEPCPPAVSASLAVDARASERSRMTNGRRLHRVSRATSRNAPPRTPCARGCPAACARSHRSAASKRVWIAAGRQLGLGFLRAPDAQLRIGDRRDVRMRASAKPAAMPTTCVSVACSCCAIARLEQCRRAGASAPRAVAARSASRGRSRCASANRPPDTRAVPRLRCPALEPGLHRRELRIALVVGRRRELRARPVAGSEHERNDRRCGEAQSGSHHGRAMLRRFRPPRQHAPPARAARRRPRRRRR